MVSVTEKPLNAIVTGSLSVIVPRPEASLKATPLVLVKPLSSTVKLSVGSQMRSLIIGTVIVLVVPPGDPAAKVSVPVTEV